jgi:hypothetical protein
MILNVLQHVEKLQEIRANRTFNFIRIRLLGLFRSKISGVTARPGLDQASRWHDSLRDSPFRNVLKGSLT